jgi:hypothetical protein
MPKGGYYFHKIVRQKPIIEERLDLRDNLEYLILLGEQYSKIYEQQSIDLFGCTIRQTLETTGNCHLEMIMNYNHTLGNNPENEVHPVQIVRQEIKRAHV